MTLDTVSISSDDDDTPLNKVGASLPAHPHPVDLMVQTLENCEFCEQVSSNKYDALVHNAKHIIIPLLKQEVHQCELCLFYFTSRYKLKHHLRNKHKNDNINKETQQKTNDKTKNEQKTNEIVVKNEKTTKLKTIETVVKNETTKCETDEDDLPLKVTQKLELVLETPVTEETENCAVKSEDDTLREAREKLIKDVKVVIEKLETEITNNISMNVVPEKEPRENNAKVTTNMETKINETLSIHNAKAALNIETNATLTHQRTNFPFNIEPAKPTDHNPIPIPDRAKVKINNRLKFEEDLDDICNDEVIKDLTNNCLVDMNLFDEPWLDDLANSIADEDLVNLKDDIILIDDDDDDEQPDRAPNTATDVIDAQKMDIEYAPSTHHDELIKPGVFKCKRCPELLPTKFNQIQHEMQHIRIRKPRPLLCEHCDRFFATKQLLKAHLTSTHKAHYRLRVYKTCKKCNLKYNNYDTHLQIYHVLLRCHLCNEGFETEVDRLNHIRSHLIKSKCSQCDFTANGIEIMEHQKLFHRASVSTRTTTFNLCDVCCLFLKNKNNTQYQFGETVSKVGERIYCEHCGKMFFDLTKVTRFGKGRMRETDSAVFEKHKKRARSNTERLKNIQQRLKMINKLSRF